MSNARKLQTEIDRVMKKVDEGAELFDEIYLKVKNADAQNLKEKHEVDLKKEIKKLQRLRDQIKTWIGSSDVKDKDNLMEARRLIETKMEQFKVCEKETKTKTYSKEGLAREEKLDPAEEAKLKTIGWVKEYVDKFEQLVEEKDFEIEKLSAGKGKKTNKHQITELNKHILKHKFHISKLEGIIRLVNNDVLEVEPVDDIKEELDYYLESFEDEDYIQAYDEEYFYEALGLEDLDVVNVDMVTQTSSGSKKGHDDDTSKSSRNSKDVKNSKKSSISSVIPLTIGRARSKADKKAEKEAAEKEKQSTPSKKEQAPARATPAPAPPAPAPGASMASILKRETEQQEKERQLKAQQEQLRQQQLKQEQLRQQEALRAQQQQAAQQEQLRQQQQQQEVLRQQQAQDAAKQQAAAHQRAAEQAQVSQSQPGQNNALDILTSGLGGLGLGGQVDNRDAQSLSSQNAAATPSGAPTGGDRSAYLTALNDAFSSAPGTGEGERSRTYTPQNPYPTPQAYPTTPPALFDNPAVFEKLGTDCLFFIFYYSQGTYQQYLAARELKKQSWRFHKKYMTWFQRHEEPKVTTDEYEQGTYVYFDYETGWCTRIKQDFRFDYSFLEDSLQ